MKIEPLILQIELLNTIDKNKINFKTLSKYFPCINKNKIEKGIYNITIYSNKYTLIDVDLLNIIKIIDIKQWGNVITNWDFKFLNCNELRNITATDIPIIKSCNGMFLNCENLKTINNIEKWDTSYLIEAISMFSGCCSFNGDLSNWNVTNMIDMTKMFKNCIHFNSDLSNWNVSNMIYGSEMFSNCQTFNSNISNWNTMNLLYMKYMFYNCINFEFELNWNVSKIKNALNIINTFDNCKNKNESLLNIIKLNQL